MTAFELLACPICGESLVLAERTLTCPSRHSFDVAREGYVNLLPAQHVRRGISGDSREMLAARRRFLDAGHYAPLAGEVAALASEALEARACDAESTGAPGLAAGEPPAVLEVGCGEGSYLAAVGDALPRALLLGCDLSKDAARLAARRLASALVFVADVHERLYMRTGAVSVLLDLFAPRNPAEFARVLEPRGSAIVGVPMPHHLQSIRDRFGLLGIQDEKERRVIDALAGDFTLAERRLVEFDLELSPAALTDLVMMGPNSHHQADGFVPPAESQTTRASVALLRFERAGA